MILLQGHASTPDELEIITGTAADIDVHVSHIDSTHDAPPAPENPEPTNTLITTATTTVIATAPTSASKVRNIQEINIYNADSADSTDVTVQIDENSQGSDVIRLYKTNLAPGEVLEWTEARGWYEYESAARLDLMLVTTADVVNATTSWADITGLTCAVKSGKTYMFEAALLYICNATTTGARFGVNGPSATYLRGGGIGTVTASVTASVHSTPAAAVSAYDTSMIGAQTTGPATEVTALIEGVLVPSADGTFAMRSQSEVATANALTIRRGSRLHIREADNA
jgi:hypothetical protein